MTAPLRSPRGTFELVRLDLLEQPGCFELGDDAACAPRSGPGRGYALRRVLVELRVGREDVDLGRLVAQADLVVVEVVRRRDLHAPEPKAAST